MSSKTSIKKAPKMSSVARGVLAGLEDAIAYMDGDTSRGRVAYGIDTAAIRQKTGLSQSAFARLLSVPVPTLQKWEQHQRVPTGAARTLLAMIDADAKSAMRLLQHVGRANASAATARRTGTP